MRKPPTHLLRWARSAEFRAIARRQCAKMNAAHARKPRCSAIAKSTGIQCSQPAKPNGKCRFHGGSTPKGDAWHQPIWPAGRDPEDISKANRKAADLEKRARQRAKRLVHRSPEEIAEHAAWQRTHRPGSAKQRRADRELRRQNAEARSLLNGLGELRQRNPADQALADALAGAEAHLRALDREAEIVENWNTGVFA